MLKQFWRFVERHEETLADYALVLVCLLLAALVRLVYSYLGYIR